jgi:hypothetical protein
MGVQMINVQPADDKRRDFARWAVAQVPKVQTSSAVTSAVPVDLFTSIPEELLVGALIDGTPYRHVVEDKEPEGAGYSDGPVTVDVPDVVAEVPVQRRTRRGSK